jgi:23S rRNA (pseudouridine1915-N3)-methyltransferase
MRLAIIAVGKVKQSDLRASLDDYLSRIRRYAACDEIELKDGNDRELTERFERALPARGNVIALEANGRAYDSPGFARYVGQCEQGAVPTVAFLIGGSYGLPAAVAARASFTLSLSQMTFPHRLARVVLAEQVYRAFTILRGEPYSH